MAIASYVRVTCLIHTIRDGEWGGVRAFVVLPLLFTCRTCTSPLFVTGLHA